MIYGLLAQTQELRPAEPATPRLVEQIHNNVVQLMPPGGLRLMFVLIALTLVVGLWIVWSQRTLARNQVKIAEMLQRHLAEHENKP